MKTKYITSLLLALIISVFIPYTPAISASFTWSLGNDVPASAFRYVDGTPGIVQDGNDVWLIYSDGATAGAPIRRYKGTSLDDLVRQSDGVKDYSFNQPYGDDVYWIMGGIWSDNGIWYSTVHVEFNYQGTGINRTWFRRIGIATSNDKGATWHYWCDIITSNHSYNVDEGTSDYFNYGPGGQHLYVDEENGYFYLYYGVAWCEKTGVVNQTPTIRVARSPISQKMDQGSWTKWYNGSWSQPGLFGNDSDINMMHANELHVSYNTYLNKYMAIGSLWNYGAIGVIMTCTDLAQQDWTEYEYFAPSNRMMWYHWSVDPSSMSMWTTGQTFRQYTSKCYVDGVESKYMNVTLGVGSTTPIDYPPIYPAHSVRDFNPGWDWAFEARSTQNTFSQNYNINLGGAYVASGTGALSRVNNQMNVTSQSSGSVLVIDSQSPITQNGKLTAKITPVSGGRCGLVFRYSSPTQWVAILYDVNGDWYICDGAGNSAKLPCSYVLTNGIQYLVNIEYFGTFYALNVNGVCIYCDSYSAATTAAGRTGVRNWYYSNTYYDDIVLKY